jgi:hypothetical protein
MQELKAIIDRDDQVKFSHYALEREIYDYDEILMFLYTSVAVFNC